MTVREVVPDSGTVCVRCGHRLVLAAYGLHYKYVQAGDLEMWKCDPTPEFPVRSHIPEKTVKELRGLERDPQAFQDAVNDLIRDRRS
jgi:hypothetical protein